MQIAIAQRLTAEHGVRGGMETQAQMLASGLLNRGHTPLVLTAPHPDGRTVGKEYGVPVRYVSPGSWRWYQPRWWDACYAELALRHRATPFDVLLSQSAGALGYIERAARDLRLPSVVILHGTTAGEFRTRLADLGSPRGIYRLVRFMWRGPELLVRWRRAARSVTHWIAIAPHIAQTAACEIGIPANRLTVIPNGIDITQFRPDPVARAVTRARLGIAADAPLLLASGRLEREKGFATAIDAFARLQRQHPDARLLIAGHGGDAGRLEAMARPLGGAARLVGRLPRPELAALLAAGDLYLMPSLCFEGLSLSLIEALASGVPVLTTASGGGPVVDHGVTGMILPPGRDQAWAAAITGLLVDERRRRAMGELARQTAIARYSRERMIQATEAVLDDARRARR